MDKKICNRCGKEIRNGIRMDGGEPFPPYFTMEIQGWTGEGGLMRGIQKNLIYVINVKKSSINL